MEEGNKTEYFGWKEYFTEEDVKKEDYDYVRFSDFIEHVIVYFSHPSATFEMPSDASAVISYNDIRNGIAEEGRAEFDHFFAERPETLLKCLGVAFYEVMCEGEDVRDEADSRWPKINVRLTGYTPTLPLKNLKSFYIGKFVSISGTVIRMGEVKPIVLSMDFQCTRCEDTQTLLLPDGKYVVPVSCLTPGCRSKLFMPLRDAAKTEDWQVLKIQENLQGNLAESGRVPRSVQVELRNDLVDSCVPGDTVTICGIVRVMSTDMPTRGNKPDKGVFLIYVDAVSVVNDRQSQESSVSHDIKESDQDLYAIQTIVSEENVFATIVNSICPGIYGHPLVKAGLALCLFGGCQKFQNDKNKVMIRGDPHILIVGDPGLGKSQMLQAVHQIAPRGVYVCGSYSSSTGLTVTLMREKGSGDHTLEAGALVLADKGICCIDEFDKLSKEHPALLEAMEQQSISIAKAGIVCSLPARASIVAAANPVGGHYNRSKTVSENLKMGAAILSRFDLVFIILDRPDEEMDKLLSEHVMALHSAKVDEETSTSGSSRSAAKSREDENRETSIFQSLKVDHTTFDPIPPKLLRKYIAYARKHVKPVLSPEAANVLQDFYLSLRKNYKSADHTPVTTRQLESLVRLAEARAKLELRTVVHKQDAQDVVDLMKESLVSIMDDNLGHIDFRQISGMSKAKQALAFVDILKATAEKTGERIFSVSEMREIAQKSNLSVDNLDQFIENLNYQGYLLSRGNRSYELYR